MQNNQLIKPTGNQNPITIANNVHFKNFAQTTRKNKKDLDLRLPSAAEIDECYQRTKTALQKIIDAKLQAKSLVGSTAEKKDEVYVKYTPTSANFAVTTTSNDSVNSNNNNRQRLIKIVEAEVDPMLPPKFKNNQKTPALPDQLMSSTAVLKNGSSGGGGATDANSSINGSKQAKKPLTAEEQKAWYIPPAISNWKNPKGFTIALDKRLAAFNNGKETQQAKEGGSVGINDNFSKLAESLHNADLKAREEIKARNKLKIKLAEKKRQENEEKLKLLAAKARESRSRDYQKRGNSRYQSDNYRNRDSSANDSIADEQRRQREKDRRERVANYERQLKYTRLSENKKVLDLVSSNSNNINNNEDPDAARIALGLFKDSSSSSATIAAAQLGGADPMIDSRLFTNSRFRTSGESQIYDAPLFNTHEAIQNIYSAGRNVTVPSGGGGDDDGRASAEQELSNLAKYDRFKVLGAGEDKLAVQQRTGAVQFTKADSSLQVDSNDDNDDDGDNDGQVASSYGLDSSSTKQKSRWDDDSDEE